METEKAIRILNKATRILELYKHMPLDEALDKMLQDLSEFKKYKHDVRISEDPYVNSRLDDYVTRLKEMNKEDIIRDLEKFTKNDLLSLANKIGLKVKSDYTKVQVINEIANHYGFIQLNDRMGDRRNTLTD